MSTELDVATVPLCGRNAIDASAGTGKTYAISRLYLRLVLESEESGDERVDQILVVTYTRAAAAELRRRIRDTLVESRAVLARRLSDDQAAEDDRILASIPRTEIIGRIRKLDEAVAGFDRSAIFTIHSFCQRALSESAFEGGRLFDCELDRDDRGVLEEVVTDFWRSRVADGVSDALAERIFDHPVLASPVKLSGEVRDYVGMRDVKLLPDACPDLESALDDVRRSWERYERAFERFVSDAVIDGDAVAIPGRCDLKKNTIKEPVRASIISGMRDLATRRADSELSASIPDEIHKLDWQYLRERVARGTVPRLPLFESIRRFLWAARHAASPLLRAEMKLRMEALASSSHEVRRRRDRQGVQSYDDLLQNLLDALGNGDAGARLAMRLRERFPAVLIDEFQDTDPVQFQIFEKIDPASVIGGVLFFVGDPKQAIYGFRRADVFSYIDARTRADRQYSLGTNRRSTEALVAGVNQLFDVKLPFLLDGVPAGRVDAVDDEERGRLETGPDDDPRPLRLAFIRRLDKVNARGQASKSLTKEEASRIAIGDTVGKIVRLLDPGRGARLVRSAARDSSRGPSGDPIRGGSIAVLVRSNRQALAIRQALAEAGVASVLAVQASVFGTEVAADLERVLDAVRDPSNERLMGAAFATSLCGVGGEAIDQARRDPGSKAALEWEFRAQRFREYNGRWGGRGFVEMFRDLVEGEEMARRLLSGPEGERRLTDLLHLGECLASESARGKRRIEALMNWFSKSRREATDGDLADGDERRMRLESDEDLVQIATLHKSKGLEYDIVFMPFAWDMVPRAIGDGDPVLCHVKSSDGVRLVLDFGSAERDRHVDLKKLEDRAELLRLFYVGVTRARHRCHVTWAAAGRGSNPEAPMAWIVHRRGFDDSLDSIGHSWLGRFDAAYKKLTDDDLWQDLLALQARAPGSIFVEEVRPPEPRSRPRLTAERPSDAPLAPLTWRAEHAPKASRILSFTALASQRGRAVTSAQVAQAAELSETPDHDEGPELPQDDVPAVDELALFPAGRLAGKCLHDIFERLPFDELDPDGDPADLDRVIRPVARESLEAFDVRDASSRVDVVTETVRLTSCADLRLGWRHPEPGSAEHFPPGSPIRLAGLPVERRVRELEFHFPLDSVDGRAFAAAVKMDPLCADVSPALDARLEGYLKGFVDLVFQGDDGSFYVVDYKSNRLGAGISAYGRDAVVADMNRHRYPLQSLIYTLALHRLLERRLGANYDPAKHLGGSFYLYLRAIRRVPGSEGAGIVWLRHDLAALLALDRAVNAGREEGKRA